MQSRRTLLLALVLLCLALAAILAGSAAGMRNAGPPAAAPQAVLADTMAAAYDPTGPTPTPSPVRTYTVRAGDTLSGIAQRFEITATLLVKANRLTNPDNLAIGQRLTIPGAGPVPESAAAGPEKETRAGPLTRLPPRALEINSASPLYRTTWVTYYGRPEVPVMGILGEYDVDALVPILRRQARAYDEVNGPDLSVTPAIHLIYGMATTRDGPDNSHLTYLEDSVVQKYIDRAAWEGMGVILDVQIGNLAPLESIRPAFKFLKYNNVQLALDPEFAMTTPGQELPGQPPGAITAGQINDVQAEMVEYMQGLGLSGHKMLIVHQFLPTMIRNKEEIEPVPTIGIVVCADGFGAPWPKISKFNAFMSENTQFAGFKLFYRWDEPIMTEGQAMGIDPVGGIGYMEITPTLIVYQ